MTKEIRSLGTGPGRDGAKGRGLSEALSEYREEGLHRTLSKTVSVSVPCVFALDYGLTERIKANFRRQYEAGWILVTTVLDN